MPTPVPDRESVVRRNAMDFLDDLLVGGRETDISDGDKANIAMFLIESLVPLAEEEESLNLAALLATEENA